jgi:hypothetical protein
LRPWARPAGGRPAEARDLGDVVERHPNIKTRSCPPAREEWLATRLHALGPRALHEFLAELARHHPEIGEDLHRRLERYAALDPRILRQVGGDRFAPRPLWRVSR